MKLTNTEILNLQTAINSIMTKELPYKVALKVGKNAKVLQTYIEDFAKDEKDLIERYAQKDESGNIIQNEDGSYQLILEKVQDFQKDITDLRDLSFDIDLFTIEEEALEEIKLTAQQVLGLEAIIEC